MKKVIVFIIQVILCILIIGGGIHKAKSIMEHRKTPKKTKESSAAPLVNVITARKEDCKVTAKATGIVRPSKEIIIRPQINGEIVWASSKCAPGCFVNKGDILFKIDSHQYELAVDRQKALVAQARSQLELEQGRQTVAKREWTLLGSKTPDTTNEGLALRKPQLDNVQASLQSALSTLKRAEIDVERCTIRAPFNGVVLEKYTDAGQVVGTANQLLKFVSRESFWIYATIPLSVLNNICDDSPLMLKGKEVTVSKQAADVSIVKKGVIKNILPSLEQNSRLARMLIEVKDPLEPPEPPLLLYTFVDLEIQAKRIPGSFRIPRSAIREGDIVWITDRENHLQFRNVTILWREESTVVVKDGIDDGDLIITSIISSPVPGMTVRTHNRSSSQSKIPTTVKAISTDNESEASNAQESSSDN